MKKKYQKPGMKVVNMQTISPIAESNTVQQVGGGTLDGPVKPGDGTGGSTPRAERFNVWEE